MNYSVLFIICFFCTGGHGLGAALVRRLSGEYRVVFSTRSAELTEKLPGIHFPSGDFAFEENVRRFAARVLEEVGAVAALINNAGELSHPEQPVKTKQNIERVFF